MLRRDERTMAWEYDGFIFLKRYNNLKLRCFGRRDGDRRKGKSRGLELISTRRTSLALFGRAHRYHMPTLLCAITLEQYTRQVGMEWYGRTNGSYLLLPPLSKTVERDDIRLKSDITIRPESKRKDQTIYPSTADEDDHFKR
jgi:hypothetical protein